MSDPDQLIEICRKLCEKAVDHMTKEELKVCTFPILSILFGIHLTFTSFIGKNCNFESENGSVRRENSGDDAGQFRLRFRISFQCGEGGIMRRNCVSWIK